MIESSTLRVPLLRSQHPVSLLLFRNYLLLLIGSVSVVVQVGGVGDGKDRGLHTLSGGPDQGRDTIRVSPVKVELPLIRGTSPPGRRYRTLGY